MDRKFRIGDNLLFKREDGSEAYVIFWGYLTAREAQVEMNGVTIKVLTESLRRIPDKEPEECKEIGRDIDHPSYYNRYSIEVVEMARRIWGDEAMKTAAEITAFIYRMRAGTKPDNPVEKDLNKEQWWLDYKNNKLK